MAHTPPLTVDQAAAYLNLAARTVRQLCEDKKLRHFRLGPKNKAYRIPLAALEQYLEKSMVGPESEPEQRPRRKNQAQESLHPGLLRAISGSN